ncbi:hypothetical protein [Streptomyces sp. NPDC090798]|uniref:hypothetical protein n=1 Tax=Streptomyces sp. NPDC090798 TaxID=3365968 RepID=UPI0038211024
MRELERITARRSELDALAEELGKRVDKVCSEREELVIAERVPHRPAAQDRIEVEAAVAAAPVKAQVAGRAVLLIPFARAVPDSDPSRPVPQTQWGRRTGEAPVIGSPIPTEDVSSQQGQIRPSKRSRLSGNLRPVAGHV